MSRGGKDRLRGTVEVDEAFVGDPEAGRYGRAGARKSMNLAIPPLRSVLPLHFRFTPPTRTSTHLRVYGRCQPPTSADSI